MKRPALRNMILGHPIVGVPVSLSCLGLIYICCFQTSGGILLGLIPLGMLLAVGRASQEMVAYKAWKQEWDAMSPKPALRAGWLSASIGIVLGVVLLFGGAAALQADPSQLFGWIVMLGPVPLAVLAIWTVLRWGGRRHARGPQPVPVRVIANAILPAPPLAAAYAALPDYCHRLLVQNVREVRNPPRPAPSRAQL